MQQLIAERDKLTANRPNKTKSKLSKADYEKAWRKRKRIVKEIIDTVLENSEMTKKNLLETIGLETDEDAGVTLP
jgi:Leucine zipper with capping helix domain